METYDDIKTEIDSQNSSSDNPVSVKSDQVQSEVNNSDEEKSDAPPRRNGLFSITGSLKVLRNFAPGK